MIENISFICTLENLTFAGLKQLCKISPLLFRIWSSSIGLHVYECKSLAFPFVFFLLTHLLSLPFFQFNLVRQFRSAESFDSDSDAAILNHLQSVLVKNSKYRFVFGEDMGESVVAW